MDTPCIEHTGACTENGYGRLYDPTLKRTVRAHRKVWTDAHGPIPSGKVVMHRCDNRKCVNLEHLKLGSQSENLQDMHDKGRHNPKLPTGAAHHLTTLSAEEAAEIKRTAAPGNYRELARRYGISRVTIRNIATGRTWSCLP